MGKKVLMVDEPCAYIVLVYTGEPHGWSIKQIERFPR